MSYLVELFVLILFVLIPGKLTEFFSLSNIEFAKQFKYDIITHVLINVVVCYYRKTSS